MKIIPLLGPKLTDQTPEAFHAYAKSLEKPWKTKAEIKTKTRKKKQDDTNAELRTDSAEGGSKEDARDLDLAGRSDLGGNQLFELITD